MTVPAALAAEQALMIELSREYLDPAVRARVLARVHERLGREAPSGGS